MNIRAQDVLTLLQESHGLDDPLVIVPRPIVDTVTAGAASIDLRLGTWFLTLRQARIPLVQIYDPGSEKSARTDNRTKYELATRETRRQLSKEHYVRFGENYVLHPRAFVLGTTLEWIRLPRDYCGLVAGKSSWGRSGLIVATAPVVHPGFTGCITLELTNLGEVPIPLMPGIRICQISLQQMKPTDNPPEVGSMFLAGRKPVFAAIQLDKMASELCRQVRRTTAGMS